MSGVHDGHHHDGGRHGQAEARLQDLRRGRERDGGQGRDGRDRQQHVHPAGRRHGGDSVVLLSL